MHTRDWFILSFTFLVGLFSGMYLYVTAFAPAYSSQNKPFATDSSFSITGAQYGGCMMGSTGCASFMLEKNKTYHYSRFPESDVEKGKIPTELFEAVYDLLSVENLSSLAVRTNAQNCISYVDGIDHKYAITFESITYQLDTCKTSLDSSDPLQEAFVDVWSFMEKPTTTYPVILEKGVGGLIEKRLKDSFQR